ncbi:MAG: GumC family protein [bacterium]
MEEEISLVDIINVIRKRRNYIIILFIVAVLSAYVFSKVSPKVYSAKAVILLPQGQETGISAQLLQSLPVGGLIGGVSGGSGSNYLAILKSRSAAEYVVDRLKLEKLYRSESKQQAIDSLLKVVRINDTKDNTIEITAEANTPKLAADIANTYIDALEYISSRFMLSSSQRERVFLEKRLTETKKLLEEAESKLKNFEERYKLVSIDDETKALIDNMANIQSQRELSQIELDAVNSQIVTLQKDLMAQARLLGKDPLTITAISSDPNVKNWRDKLVEDESNLAVLLQDYGELHPKVIALKEEIEEIKRVIRSEIERFSNALGTLSTPDLFDLSVKRITLEARIQAMDGLIKNYEMKLEKLPELGLRLSRLTRDVKLQETIYATLSAQYEQAKISEARESLNIQVLDYAVPPEKRSKPNTVINILIAGVASLFLGIFLAFFLEFWENLKEELAKNESTKL